MIEREAATLKRQVIEALERLPDDATIDDIIDCAIVVHKVLAGIAQADAGETVSHEEARRLMARWLQ